MQVKKYILGIMLLGSVVACKKVPNGFQSDTIRYKDNDLYAKRGLILYQSDPINADGSTPPYSFKMLNLRGIDGSPAPKEFTTSYQILVFKDGLSFDPATDTTVAQLAAKRELKTVPPMSFNEVSGQLSFNRGSINLPLGKYTYDVQFKNPTGTKFFPALATINVVDPTVDDLFVITDDVANAFNDITGVATPIKNPVVTCTRISADGARVILKMVDKNNVPFNPKTGEIIQRGDRPVFENYAKFNPVLKNDTAMICDFEVAPFPLQKYVDATTDWGFLMYYRIPSQFVKPVAGLPTTATFSINPRWSWQVKLEGTYIVQVKFTDVEHK